MSLADLRASIFGEAPADRPMLVGRALETVLARPGAYFEAGLLPTYHQGGYRFLAGELAPLVDELRDGLFQVKTVSTYGDHQVVCKADYLHGLLLREFKTTWGSFDADRYASSLQWRYMAEAFRPALVSYDVLTLAGDKGPDIRVKAIDSVRLYPYPKLRADCESWVNEFVEFVEDQGWGGELAWRQLAYA